MGSCYSFVGRWIGADMGIEDRRAPIFKKCFNVNKKIEAAKIYICGLGLFELKINGILPDDTVLNPAHTQYSKRALYREFDVAELLVEGNNEITVELGNSFFNEPTDVWKWDTASWRSPPELILDLNIFYSSSEKESIVSDESWEVSLDGAITQNSIYYGETHDLRKKSLRWKKAVLVEAPEGELKPQEMPHIKRIAQLKPREIINKGNGTYIVVSPEMVTGWARVSINIPDGVCISICYSENLTAEGYVVKTGKGENRDGNWWPLDYIQQDRFIGNGEFCILEPKFSYKGFKYIQVENCPVELTYDNITIFRVANAVEEAGFFECSDENLNKLHALMQRTLLNNFQGKPTDTPVWEKNGWLGDLNCGLNSMLYCFELSQFLKSFTDTMRDCFLEYGTVPIMVPTADWGTENSPVWNTVFVFAAKALLDFYNEKEYVERLYPELKSFAQKDIEELKKQGWVWNYKGLADWVAPIGEENMESDPNSSEGNEICATAFIYGMLKAMAYIADRLGKAEDIPEYEFACESIYKAFNSKLYNAQKGCYETSFWEQRGNRTKYRQTSNLLPIYFGLVPDECKKNVLDNLVGDIKMRGFHLDTGCTGTRFLLPVLFDNGYEDVAYKLLTQTTYPSWCFWLKNGADSAWESWETTTRSQDHYFLATYEEAFFSHLAGIKNIREGYRFFTIEPELNCGLDYVKADMKTPFGMLKVHWEKKESGFNIKIKVPEGATAEVRLKGVFSATKIVSGEEILLET